MERQERWGQAPLDRTEPRLEAELRDADNVMAAETRSTGYYYNRQRIQRRDPEVRREGNDVTQAGVPIAIRSPGSAILREPDLCPTRTLRTMFYREEEGAERGPVQRATLGPRSRQLPRAHPSANVRARHVPTAGHDHGIPTGSEYAGVGNQKDFDPNADGVMVHADCYLVINGNKEGHSIHASYFGDAERDIQHGAIVRGFRDIAGEPLARVRATRMVLALPEAKTIQYTPQATLDNIHGDRIDT